MANMDPKLQAALKSVAFYHLDAEKGEGPGLAKQYAIRGYPTFVMTDADGRLLNRWWGFRSPREFMETLALAADDPMPVPEREARMARAPTAHDAALLARVRLTDGDNRGADSLYAIARKLNKDPKVDYTWDIFDVVSSGYPDDFPYARLKAAADQALAKGSPEPGAIADLAMMMVDAGKEEKLGTAEWAPYMKAGLKASEGTTDNETLRTRRFLLVDNALFIEKDMTKALQYERDTMAPGWETRPATLNRFAGWCAEYKVNLEEAETLARKAVELGKPGRAKAAYLDTLAEVLAARGKPADALAAAQQAVGEDPKNAAYPKQVERFKAMLPGAGGSGGANGTSKGGQ